MPGWTGGETCRPPRGHVDRRVMRFPGLARPAATGEISAGPAVAECTYPRTPRESAMWHCARVALFVLIASAASARAGPPPTRPSTRPAPDAAMVESPDWWLT